LTFTDSFAATVLISLALVFAYTYRGGLKQLLSEYFTNFFLVSLDLTLFHMLKV
jgi:hypothetical protein